MSGRMFLLIMLLAALVTAVTFFKTREARETLSEPGLADLDRVATVHGWPWGYYAEVQEVVQLGQRRVAVMRYGEMRPEALFQTFALWFLVWLLLIPALLLTMGGRSRRP